MWRLWYKRLKAHKQAMANPPADEDIAAALDEDPRVRKKVGRGSVNHWFNGRREPELSQFFVLCELLKADPAQILGLDMAVEASVPPEITKHDARQPRKQARFSKRNTASKTGT